jgi:hypothetical protein
MAKVLKIKADGSHVFEEVKMVEGEIPLEYLQEAVDGYIEAVRLPHIGDDVVLWLNEEGKLRGLPFNAIATGIAAMDFDYVAGDAIITCVDGFRTVGLTEEAVTKLVGTTSER